MAVPTFTLKVNINCCSQCPLRAREKLKKIEGLDSITIDGKKGLVTISGRVDPTVIIEKFARWGKKAELWSFRKEPILQSANSKRKSCAIHAKVDDHSSSESDSDSNKPSSVWLGKNINGLKMGRNKSLVTNVKPAGKWHFPRTPMQEFGASMPLYGGQFHARPLYGRRAMPSHPIYGARPPVMPPHGAIPLRPRPLSNPMIHCTSYDNNYHYW